MFFSPPNPPEPLHLPTHPTLCFLAFSKQRNKNSAKHKEIKSKQTNKQKDPVRQKETKIP